MFFFIFYAHFVIMSLFLLSHDVVYLTLHWQHFGRTFSVIFVRNFCIFILPSITWRYAGFLVPFPTSVCAGCVPRLCRSLSASRAPLGWSPMRHFLPNACLFLLLLTIGGSLGQCNSHFFT